MTWADEYGTICDMDLKQADTDRRVGAVEAKVGAVMVLEEATNAFAVARNQAYNRRDAAVRRAALVLTQKEIAEITGLSAETIRKITKGYPVSWPRRVTVRGLAR